MKILFLDIDGVLVLDPYKGKDEGVHGHDPFHKPSVDALNDIISSTKCEIVITSGWLRFFDLEQMQEIFQWNGARKVPIGFTQDYNGDEKQLPPGKEIEILRCMEVMSWLSTHDTNGRFSWCAVDDMDLSLGLDYFVRCPDNNYRLSYRGVTEKIISTLNNIGRELSWYLNTGQSQVPRPLTMIGRNGGRNICFLSQAWTLCSNN